MTAKTSQPAGDADKNALTHVENTLDPIIFSGFSRVAFGIHA